MKNPLMNKNIYDVYILCNTFGKNVRVEYIQSIAMLTGSRRMYLCTDV